uniref:Uncharacterized protein n=1 Tax=Anguilla anguilla TaxID=7936 RepID=A0A0E9XFZ8_ANGAN
MEGGVSIKRRQQVERSSCSVVQTLARR